MKGLEDAIGVSVVHPTWQHTKPGEVTLTRFSLLRSDGGGLGRAYRVDVQKSF